MTAFALILSLLITADPASQIAYISVDPAGATSLQLMDVDSHSSTLIAEGPARDQPAWSHDGATLAWVDAADNGVQLWTAGTGAVRALPNQGGRQMHPRWFPGGATVAVTHYAAPEAPPQVIVHDTDSGKHEAWGGEMGRSVGGLVVQGLLQAEWLPSGRLILALDPEEKLSIDGMDMDTLREEAGIDEESLRADLPPRALFALALIIADGRLTTEPVLVTRTQLLPILLLPGISEIGDSLRFDEWNIVPNRDGDRVAFESNQGGDREIYVISRIGQTNASNHHAADQHPVWGDSRRMLLFESFRDGRRGIYSAIADTARVNPVATGPDFNAWSPACATEGDAIAYIADNTGTPELYADVFTGGAAVQLTAHPPGGMALAPAWRPEAK